ncbi:efflux RND transporter periplasmic adaptor subunit [Desulfococcus sp.]|uniref:efflux RND transporter periplasmic adaptor subunit n=1 Tax=Desulfococcus sp. TaxID=2025834 RepID=UPI003D0C9FF6
MRPQNPIPKKIWIPLVSTIVLAISLIIGYEPKQQGTTGPNIRDDALSASEDWFSDFVQPPPTGHDHDDMIGIATADASKTIFICPMNCVQPMAKPGKCPVCGMDLVEIPAPDETDDDQKPGISLSDKALSTAAPQTAKVSRQAVSAEIRLFGKIEYDPVEQYKVTAFAPGIIDRIYVKRAGQTVRRGDPLFDMHSSELYFLEQELAEVLKLFPDDVDYRPARGQIYKRQMRPPRRQFHLPKPDEATPEEMATKKAALEKLEQIRRKMMLLGLSNADIDRIIARGVPTGISTVTTPTTGVVLNQFAFKGAYVNTGEAIFTIANPKYIWARLDGYASDFSWIRMRQDARIVVDAYPGEVFEGKVVYIDPEFDPATRTFKIGVLFSDPEKKLRPNMLARGIIQSRMASEGTGLTARGPDDHTPLVIPETAPLITGSRAIVYVADPRTPGKFEGREVVLGPRAGGYYIVKSGLVAGETVVVNGAFKIDSAVQILAGRSMMDHGGGSVGTASPQVLMEAPAEGRADDDRPRPDAGLRHQLYRGLEQREPADK